VAILAAFLWASDQVTIQGERTIYTVDCKGGAWQGPHCTGTLAAGERNRFRALRQHGEVLFWTIGSPMPSGKFAACEIIDGRNWTCKPNADAAQTITLQLKHGSAVAMAGAPTKAFHAVPKWRWWLLHRGLAIGSDADN
jgi:hypothetical protein